MLRALAISLGLAQAAQGSGFPAPFETLELHGQGGRWLDEKDPTLLLPVGSWARVRLSRSIDSDAGTLSFSIRPEPAGWEGQSHVFLSLAWPGGNPGYLAAAEGWWEPGGAGTLFMVLNNQFASCDAVGGRQYRWFRPGTWSRVTATWRAGAEGGLSLYVDGRKVCSRKGSVPRGIRSGTELYIGSDRGAADQRQRASGFSIRGLSLARDAVTEEQAWAQVRAKATSTRFTWLDGFLDERQDVPVVPTRIAVFDEDRHWLDGRQDIDRLVARLRSAHVDTYVPCIWDGQSIAARSGRFPVEPRFAAAVADGFDPLAYLVASAHAAGIRVKLWFDVTRHVGPGALDRYAAGAPANAFNVHDAEFRTFIAEGIVESYSRYAADGLNLDYVRSQGECALPGCEAEYGRRYSRSLAGDHRSMLAGNRIDSLAGWNAGAVEDVLVRVRAALNARGRKDELSVDTVPFDHERVHEGVDAVRWLDQGLVDRIYHMAYGNPFDVLAVDHSARALGCERLSVLVQDYEMVGDRAVDYDGTQLDQVLRLAAASWPGCEVGLYHYPHLADGQLHVLSQRAATVGR